MMRRRLAVLAIVLLPTTVTASPCARYAALPLGAPVTCTGILGPTALIVEGRRCVLATAPALRAELAAERARHDLTRAELAVARLPLPPTSPSWSTWLVAVAVAVAVGGVVGWSL